MVKIGKDIEKEELSRIAQESIKRLTIIDRAQKGYELMFYGFSGKEGVAKEAILSILRSYNDFRVKPERIFVVGNSRKKSKKEIDQKREEYKHFCGEAEAIQHNIVLKYLLTDETEELKECITKTDLFFLTANLLSRKEAKKLSIPPEKLRLEMTKKNLDLIDQISGLLPKNYPGHIHIVTNLPEVLCYKLALDSKLNPYHISGSCHLDKMRLDKILTETIKQKGIKIVRTQGFCIGYHDDPWPVLNKIRIDKGFGYFEKLTDTEGVQDDIYKIIKKYGQKQAELAKQINLEEGPTTESTGDAIKEFALAYINRGILINAAIYYEGMYLELPTHMEDGIVRANKNLLKRRTEKDEIEFEKRRQRLEEIINSFRGTKISDGTLNFSTQTERGGIPNIKASIQPSEKVTEPDEFTLKYKNLKQLLSKEEKIYGVSLPDNILAIEEARLELQRYTEQHNLTDSKRRELNEVEELIEKRSQEDYTIIDSFFNTHKNYKTAKKMGLSSSEIERRTELYTAIGWSWGDFSEKPNFKIVKELAREQNA